MEGDRTATLPAEPGTEAPAAKATVIPREVYRIDHEHARGGCGRILRAHDLRLGREVAIKELLPGEHTARRFEREVRLTARLQHPGIVPIYEAGTWPTGEPFYAMKFVEGRSLKEIILATSGLGERLALLPNVIAVADAVAYAHSRRVIHRDLKPSNVVVGPFGETMVIDWGLAKDLDDASPDDVPAGPFSPSAGGETEAGTILGTPAYMPPEQAAAEPVDQRADVYALGAMLYHLLAGRPPFGKTQSVEILELIRTSPPQPLRQLVPQVPRDLVAIVEKAMARRVVDRYPDARALVEDLRRFESGQLVAAQRYSTAQLVRRWLRRRWVAVTVGLLLVAGAVVAQARILAERDRARRFADALLLEQAESAIATDPTAAIAWLKQYPADGPGWDRVHEIAAEAEARGIARQVFVRRGGSYLRFSPDGERLAVTGAFNDVHVYDRGGTLLTLEGHDSWVVDAVFSPDGRRLASIDKHGQPFLWTLATGEGRALPATGGRPTPRLQFSGDGQRLLVSGDGGVTMLDVESGEATKLSDGFGVATWVPEGVVYATRSGGIRLRAAATGESSPLAQAGPEWAAIAATADGNLVAASAWTGEVWKLDRQDGRATVIGTHPGLAWLLAITPDGGRIASGGEGRSVQVWERATGQTRELVHASGLSDFALSPEGARLATISFDLSVRIWDLGSGESVMLPPVATFPGTVAFSPDGERLAVSSERDTRVYPVPRGPLRTLRGHVGAISDLAVLRDGRILSAGADGTLRVWRPSGPPLVLAEGTQGIDGLAVSPDETTAATLQDTRVRLWDLQAVRLRGSVEVGLTPGLGLGTALTFSHDGRSLAVIGRDGTTSIVDVEHAVLSGARPKGPGNAGHGVRYSPDGRFLVINIVDRPLEVVDLASDTARSLELPKDVLVDRMEFAPRSSVMAFTTAARVVEVWDLATWTRLYTRDDMMGTPVAFAPDGQRLVVGGSDPMFVWERARGNVRELSRNDDVRALAWTPDGRRVVAACGDHAVRMWDVESGRTRVFLGHSDAATHVAMAADGTWFASAGLDGVVRVWPADLRDLPREPAELRAWLARATSAEIAPGEDLRTPVTRAAP